MTTTMRRLKGNDLVETVDGTVDAGGTVSWTLTTQIITTQVVHYRLAGSKLHAQKPPAAWHTYRSWQASGCVGIVEPVITGAQLPTDVLPYLRDTTVGWTKSADGFTGHITQASSLAATTREEERVEKAAGMTWTAERARQAGTGHDVVWKKLAGAGGDLPVTWRVIPGGGAEFTLTGVAVEVVGTWTPR